MEVFYVKTSSILPKLFVARFALLIPYQQFAYSLHNLVWMAEVKSAFYTDWLPMSGFSGHLAVLQTQLVRSFNWFA